MTTETKVSLRELEKAATPAPWTTANETQVLIAPRRTGEITYDILNCRDGADAALIVAMRNALPLLLDVVDAARESNHGLCWSSRVAIALAALDAAE